LFLILTFQLHIADKDADNLYSQLDEMYQGFKQRYSKSDVKVAANGNHITLSGCRTWTVEQISV